MVRRSTCRFGSPAALKGAFAVGHPEAARKRTPTQSRVPFFASQSFVEIYFPLAGRANAITASDVGSRRKPPPAADTTTYCFPSRPI
jgi:hypothetical protein